MVVVGFFGLSFLTPLAALFGLGAAVPLAALAARRRRSQQIRRAFDVNEPNRRKLVPEVMALALLPALIGIAAAQPVVVHTHFVSERTDAQAFFILDTSTSMDASAGPGLPIRLARAKRLALRLQAALPDVPIGIVSMTDRTLPVLMPTTDRALFARTLSDSIHINQPPPSRPYTGRATTFAALTYLIQSSFYSRGVAHRLVVFFTDGEASPTLPALLASLRGQLSLLLVHVWAPGEQIYDRDSGRLADPKYKSDPSSTGALDQVAQITGGRAFSENQLGPIAHAARQAVGYARGRQRIPEYARVALAPWFVIAGFLPLGFLLWRRNL
jgi:hypothetical protein